VSNAKKPDLRHQVHELIAQRWSPYVFDDRPVKKADLLSVFEAARWAASSRNEQPWRFIIATKEDPAEFERLLSCLVEGNQKWARHAPVLVIGLTSKKFERNDKPNGTARHDLGLAAATLTLEATARGLSVHQMAGIVPDRIREIYKVPDDFDIVTAIAIGYAGEPEGELGERDQKPRKRRPLSEFLFSGTFGKAFQE
jgi:nitroreductase